MVNLCMHCNFVAKYFSAVLQFSLLHLVTIKFSNLQYLQNLFFYHSSKLCDKSLNSLLHYDLSIA